MIGKKAGGIYYFDPLGNAPETDLELTGEKPGMLRKIFRGKRVKYNKTKYQSEKSNTCGRHVAIRAKMFKLSDPAYKTFICDNPDKRVSLLSYVVTHKGERHKHVGDILTDKHLWNQIPIYSVTGTWYP